ncbi:MAG: hypothetical protein RJA09_863, partial [Pseudomonadota bacterium]
CWRSLEEIRQWSRSSDADKKALWVLVEDRQRQAGLSPT